GHRALGRDGATNLARNLIAPVHRGVVHLDRLRLSRRAFATWVALRQFALRTDGHVRVCEGFVLFAQGVVQGGWRAVRASAAALEFVRRGLASSRPCLFELRVGRVIRERRISRKKNGRFHRDGGVERFLAARKGEGGRFPRRASRRGGGHPEH